VQLVCFPAKQILYPTGRNHSHILLIFYFTHQCNCFAYLLSSKHVLSNYFPRTQMIHYVKSFSPCCLYIFYLAHVHFLLLLASILHLQSSHWLQSFTQLKWHYTVSQKNVPLCDCLYLCQKSTDFQNSFTDAFYGQLAIK